MRPEIERVNFAINEAKAARTWASYLYHLDRALAYLDREMTNLAIVEKALEAMRHVPNCFSWRFYCMILDGYLAKYLQESKS